MEFLVGPIGEFGERTVFGAGERDLADSLLAPGSGERALL